MSNLYKQMRRYHSLIGITYDLGCFIFEKTNFEVRRFLQIITPYYWKSINSEILCYNKVQQSVISSSDVHTWRVRKQQSVISSLDVHTWMVLKLMEPHFIVNLYFNIQIPSKPQTRCCSQKYGKREHHISWSNYSIESFDMTRLLTAVRIIIAPHIEDPSCTL